MAISQFFSNGNIEILDAIVLVVLSENTAR